MALNPKLANSQASRAADAVCARFNDGYLYIETAPQPTNANTGLTTQTTLAVCRFSNPAFGSAVNGVASANTIAPENDAPAAGIAAFFRCLESDNSTEICDGSIATSNANLILNDVNIALHDTVAVTAFVYVQQQT